VTLKRRRQSRNMCLRHQPRYLFHPTLDPHRLSLASRAGATERAKRKSMAPQAGEAKEVEEGPLGPDPPIPWALARARTEPPLPHMMARGRRRKRRRDRRPITPSHLFMLPVPRKVILSLDSQLSKKPMGLQMDIKALRKPIRNNNSLSEPTTTSATVKSEARREATTKVKLMMALLLLRLLQDLMMANRRKATRRTRMTTTTNKVESD